MLYAILTALLCITLQPLMATQPPAAKKFVIIIPSFNNEQWVEWNLQSVFDQTYENYRIIYIDDNSSDSTVNKVRNFVTEHQKNDRLTLLCNTHRCRQLTNRYKAILSCDNEEIMVMLDGDDALAHPHVLEKLNEIYQNENIWMAYSQYKKSCTNCMSGIRTSEKRISRQCRHPHKHLCTRPYPEQVVENNSYRTGFKGPFHLRTFYAWLYKKIHLRDLFYHETLFPMGTDSAVFFPLIEMAGTHAHYIPEVLYLYNQSNPLSVKDRAGKRRKLRMRIVRDLEQKTVYSRLENRPSPGQGYSVVLLDLEVQQPVSHMLKQINEATHVLLMRGSMLLPEHRIEKLIKNLEDTHAFGWYLDRTPHSHDAPSHSPVLEHTFAWKFEYGTKAWRKPFATTCAVFRARDVRKVLELCKNKSMEDAKQFLMEYEFESDEVGLFGPGVLGIDRTSEGDKS